MVASPVTARFRTMNQAAWPPPCLLLSCPGDLLSFCYTYICYTLTIHWLYIDYTLIIHLATLPSPVQSCPAADDIFLLYIDYTLDLHSLFIHILSSQSASLPSPVLSYLAAHAVFLPNKSQTFREVFKNIKRWTPKGLAVNPVHCVQATQCSADNPVRFPDSLSEDWVGGTWLLIPNATDCCLAIRTYATAGKH